MQAMSGFSRYRELTRFTIHAAAHSHHPWPDISLDAHNESWLDAARLLDKKWDAVFQTIIPAAQNHVARQLHLPDPASIAFGPNTHSFVVRILSCLPRDRRLRILTSGSEFMSFSRQLARFESEGLAEVIRVATEPFETFAERFVDAENVGTFDLIYLSQVFFDSGFALRNPAAIIKALKSTNSIVVIDGYHGFMALPLDFEAVASRAFYLAGGYKYAMAGEGVCFLHAPEDYCQRPRDTGWFAGFAALETGENDVGYAAGGSRFLGATFDVTGLYRFNAIQEWLKAESRTVETMLLHVRALEASFLETLDAVNAPIDSSRLIVKHPEDRGRFLAFRSSEAGKIAAALAAQNIIVDHRADRLRIGFGIYHASEDAERLAHAFGRLS